MRADLVTIRSSCGCGATLRIEMPATLIDAATKQANTWNRFHPCSIRDQIQPEADRRVGQEKYDKWLLDAVGVLCTVCEEEITEDGPEWWKIAGHWVHLDCVQCQKCGLPARGNGTLGRNDAEGQEGFFHIKCPKVKVRD